MLYAPDEDPSDHEQAGAAGAVDPAGSGSNAGLDLSEAELDAWHATVALEHAAESTGDQSASGGAAHARTGNAAGIEGPADAEHVVEDAWGVAANSSRSMTLDNGIDAGSSGSESGAGGHLHANGYVLAQEDS